jgi:hypothetical protein
MTNKEDLGAGIDTDRRTEETKETRRTTIAIKDPSVTEGQEAETEKEPMTEKTIRSTTKILLMSPKRLKKDKEAQSQSQKRDNEKGAEAKTLRTSRLAIRREVSIQLLRKEEIVGLDILRSPKKLGWQKARRLTNLSQLKTLIKSHLETASN